MILEGKKCLFLVQGEGRGHMTQSIAMKQILESAGVEVCEVIMGRCDNRQTPLFYSEKIKAPITLIESAKMAVAKNMKQVRPLQTAIDNTFRLRKFYKSVKVVRKRINALKPDFIMNFFEPACGLYHMLYRRTIPVINVAHHYMYMHPEFVMPEEYAAARFGIRFYAWINSFGSSKRLALSFYPFPDYPKKNICVVPPLIREEAINCPVKKGDYLLVYLLNSGYVEEITNWHKNNLSTELHCFVDRKGITKDEVIDGNLYLHPIDDKKYLTMMAGAKGLVTTAGFESVCEAYYMGKPALLVPVEDHYEQYCNALDGAKAGAGIHSRDFNITKLLTYLANYKGDNTQFRQWVQSAPNLIIKHIHNTLYKGDNLRKLTPGSEAAGKDTARKVL